MGKTVKGTENHKTWDMHCGVCIVAKGGQRWGSPNSVCRNSGWDPRESENEAESLYNSHVDTHYIPERRDLLPN